MVFEIIGIHCLLLFENFQTLISYHRFFFFVKEVICLKDFWSELSIPVDVVYHPVEELKGEDKHEIKAEELDMDFYSGEEMDLLTLVSEQVALNLPMKPLCTDLCKGICLKCGTDFNLGSCNCNVKDVDSRLEVLKKLLKQ